MGVLSKLDILKPLYKCGGGIYVSQVFSGANVRITADKAGSPQVKLFDDIVTTDHGGAWLYISQPLVESSLVTAVQEFNGDVSPPETVTVSPIPYNQEYLETPVVIPPLYACGTIIPFDRIVNGATTDVFVTGVKKATLPLPGPRVNLWWSPLVKGDEISARQRLCKTQSSLSTKVPVQSYPKKSLPKPVITPPVYNCSTAIQVTSLVTGALVTVYVDGDYTHPYTTAPATGESAIIPIKPVNPGAVITVDQRFCKLVSPKAKNVTVLKAAKLPAPVITAVAPDYVTVDGILSAELRVVNVTTGKDIGARTCSGAGTVVNISPSLKLGEKVVAYQFFSECSKESPPSTEVPYECPPILFDPKKWNDGGMIQGCNNCYNYACDIRTDNFAQPGKGASPPVYPWPCQCSKVKPAAEADGLVPCKEKCPGCSHKVALVMDPGFDFHWYRQDSDGTWSHKPGCSAARNTDESDHPISNPETCDRGGYTDFCGYFCVDKTKVNIKGGGCKCW